MCIHMIARLAVTPLISSIWMLSCRSSLKPISISQLRHFLALSKSFISYCRVYLVFVLEGILQILFARLKGIFTLLCLGWHELRGKFIWSP